MNTEEQITGAKLRALWLVDRTRWFAIVRAALVASRSRGLASKALAVSTWTLNEWIRQEPTVVEGIEMRGPGRPAGSKTYGGRL